MDIRQKYLKYKKKYFQLKNQYGGLIERNPILEKIMSIGFEFETQQMSPFIKSNRNELRCINDKIKIYSTYDNDIEIFITPDTPMLDKDIPVYSVYFINNLCNNNSNNFLINDGEFRLIKCSETSGIAFKHAEFHFTFKNIIPNNNVIYHYLNESLNFVNIIFSKSNTELSLNNKITINNCNEQIDKLIVTEQANIYNNRSGLSYIIPNRKNINTYNTINWVIQTTIGIHLENVISVLSYLDLVNSHSESYWAFIVRVSSFIINKFCEEYDYSFDDIDIQKFLNWITIIIYEIGNANFDINGITVLKYKLTFISRHTLCKMFPINIKRAIYIEWYNFTCYKNESNIKDFNSLIEQLNFIKEYFSADIANELYSRLSSKILFTIIGDIIENALKNNNDPDDKILQRNENGSPIISQYTHEKLFTTIHKTTTKYNIENNILLFEFRSLYKLLDIEQNKQGIDHIPNKITLDNLDRCLKSKLVAL